MPRGGDRRAAAARNGKKVGPKPKPKIQAPVLSKSLAIELYQDPSTRQRWEKLRNAKDQRLRFDVEREISHQAIGRPMQREQVGFDPAKPYVGRVVVEIIGGSRAKDSAAAKTS